MQAETVTRNTSFLTFSYIVQKALAFFYFIFVARALGVEDLGKYTFALSFTTIFAVFVDLGLTNALIRESAKEEKGEEKLLSATLGVKLIVSIFVYALIVLAVNLMNYPDVTRDLVYISGFVMLMDQFTLSFFGIFRGRRNLKLESLSVIINQAIILISGLTVIFLKLPLVCFFIPFFLGSLFNLIYSAINVQRLGVKYSFSFDWKMWKLVLKLATPFALIAIFSRIYGNIDTVLLSKMVGDEAVGFYGVAMKVPFALQFIPSALAAAIFPAFSYQFSHDREQLKQTFDRVMKFLVTAVVPVAAGIAILAKPIVLTFYGEEYAPAILPLQILMLGLLFVFLNFPLGSLLNSCNKHTANTVLVGITMVLNIILNVLLIPKYGFVGAASVFVACHGFLFIASMIVAAKIIPYGKKLLFMALGKNILAASVMEIVIVYFAPTVNFLMLIPIGAITYVTCIFALEAVTLDEIKYFSNSLIKRKAADALPVDESKQ